MTTHPAASSGHDIPLRKPDLEFDATSIPRHWMNGNAFATHFFNGLNLVFPDGERFFVKAVHDHLDRITDPVLLRQAKEFAAQEGQHANQHEKYFDCLRAQGYEVDRYLRRFHHFMTWTNRWIPASLRLSVTAGAEHYTAVLGAGAIEEFHLLADADPTMRKLIIWHATEEIEHKAVAFDVLRATHPSYLLRITGFVIATIALFGWAFVGTRMLLREDGISRRDVEAQRRLAMARDQGRGLARIRAGVRAYFRRDFHPDEQDHLELARRRLGELMPQFAS
ncbi:MAG: metal-dependent hydrolase [Deltaproteobacteria bacterium]|nr:metal-dependent hydrolase [Deltaproteobacteria bacterium]